METCPQGVCDGSGWLLEDRENRQVAVPCACRAARISSARHSQLDSAIPARYRGLSFDRRPVIDMDPLLIAGAQRWLADDDIWKTGRGLWLAGPVGTGKTSLAMLCSAQIRARGRSVAIYSLPRLLATIRGTYDSEGLTYLQLFERLADVDLLHLDDLGTERTSEWFSNSCTR